MNVNIGRIINDVETIATFSSDKGPGITRFSYSKADKLARKYLLNQFKKLGLSVTNDAVGNIRARLSGKDPEAPPVMTGSHIDTVMTGGKFDGVVGVVGALEVVRTLVEKNIQTKHPIEIVIFVEEEGSNFGSTMAGSKALIGKYSVNDLKNLKNDAGFSMYDLAKNFGFNPDDLEEASIKPGDIKAMIEMHVEQSVVLDNEKIPIGIVERIAGIKTCKIEIKGVSNHAGATPMYMRNDPMQAAASIIREIDRIVKTNTNGTTVGTIGKIDCYPNVSNIIPEKVCLYLDLRDVDSDGIFLAMEKIEKFLIKAENQYGVIINKKLIGEADAIKLSPKITDILKETAKKMEINYKIMNSGAVHDSSLLASVTQVGMIFLPSIGGRSHVPDENTKFEDIEIGCELLFNSIQNLAN